MLNWWLIVLIVVIPIIVILLAVYVLLFFQTTEDATSDIVYKVFFVLATVVGLGSVLLLPFDVANSPDPTVENKYSNTLDTALMWQIMLWTMAALAVVFCPFLMFFYEGQDPDKPKIGKQIAHGIIMTIIIFGIFAIITGVCYWKVGVALVPYEDWSTYPQNVEVNGSSITYNSTYTNATLTIDVSFTTYCIGMLCFFGWIFFLFYGGVGMLAWPIRTLLNFKNRLKRINASRFTQEMAIVLAKAEALLEVAVNLQKQARGKMSRGTKNKINIIRNEVYFLEAHQDQLIWAYTQAGGSPFIVFGKLALTIICLGTGIVWILHIFLYNTFNADPFLNTLLIKLNDAFALCGVAAYAVLAFYLMWATFEGQLILGLRLIFFQIHPMKKGDTQVNAFLFNATLLNITAFAVLQFVCRSFQGYAPLTSLNGLMNVYVMHLKGIGQVIKWIQYGLVGVALLSIILVAICSKKKKRDITKVSLK
ncbi:LMBR1 domain-containing protein 1 [Strigomonas culicis]|uniref:LMBR1 domain-containing protein 1 n=2 Tax=Strigomonas culicis TaxID=28005 RepID=S9VAI4_9TRYP|nr:LMBR1 domain-containing protein 1 [Strigomonas culicis]EPY35605.1 LMBR1 domain-containing protein 1 [Strigomonas culicis]|eukprot:EPY24011.1 LMBR1 domain-containing protein 1 [Strigomonas culicis]